MDRKVKIKEVKVKSPAIKEIKEEMTKIIEKSESETMYKSNMQTENNLDPIFMGTKEGGYRSIVLTDKFMRQKW